MKEFALSIGTTPIPLPGSVKHIVDNAENFGQNLWKLAIEVLLVIALILSLGFLILAGIQWITSGGNKEKVQKAHDALIYAIVGLVIVFLAFLLVRFIGAFFNVSIF